MNRIKFQSYVEQVAITISHPDFNFDYYSDVYELMIREFSVKNIIDLDCLDETIFIQK